MQEADVSLRDTLIVTFLLMRQAVDVCSPRFDNACCVG